MKIMLVGGGTAGHVTPLLAVAHKLIELGKDSLNQALNLYYIGQIGDSSAHLIKNSKLDIKVELIRAGKYRRYHNQGFISRISDIRTIMLNVRDAYYVVIGLCQSIYILRKIKPDAVFCKGGYVVVPVGWACRLLRIPYMTHDSDMQPGLANRLIANGAAFHAVANNDVKFYPKEKTVVSGVPVSKQYENISGSSITKIKEKLGLPAQSRVLYINSGTLGAKVIDDAMRIIAPSLLEKNNKLHIVHVFGKLNQQNVTSVYQGYLTQYGDRIHTLTFVNNGYEYLAISDVVLTRAGATMLVECSAVGRAVVSVPAEQLSGGHQIENANYYRSKNSVVVVREADLPDGLEAAILSILSNYKLQKSIAEQLKNLYLPGADEVIARKLLEIAC